MESCDGLRRLPTATLGFRFTIGSVTLEASRDRRTFVRPNL